MDAFEGPFFVVGFPRSGTKLLRGLLSRHPNVLLPKHESHVFIQLIESFGPRLDLSKEETLHAFVNTVNRSVYASLMATEGFGPLEMTTLTTGADLTSWPSVLRAVQAHFSDAVDGPDRRVWGDKTPFYLHHMMLLHQTMPGARFIHIIRDVRDVSASHRKIWSKNPLRTAVRWSKSMRLGDEEAARLPAGCYLEIRYESLLNDPRPVLTKVFDHLGLRFHEACLNLADAPEDYGYAKGQTRLVADNAGRGLQVFTKRILKRMEEASYDALIDKGYAPRYATGPRAIGPARLAAAFATDAASFARHHVAREGLVDGLRTGLRLAVEARRFRTGS